MKKIVFIAPHLSTGGMPQYLVKQIELIKDDCEVYCVEWGNVTGGVLVVQRNKMVKLLGDRLITLGENKHELFDVINRIQPDVVHLQEIPELFMQGDVADKLYSSDRNYSIIETSHDSGYNTGNKSYLPDKFLMVSQYQANKYERFGIPVDIVEYPIENKTRTKTRIQALRDLGLDPNFKHVINVGLFTPRKNQAEIIEYARILQNYPIQFHFIGNQADNFKFYWEPLMKDFPSNCKWWNERSDVDNFYEAADLFLFTSRGHATDMETMPLVIRESLSWKTPSLIYNLPVYMGYFDTYNTIEYLSDNIQENAYKIAMKLFREEQQVHIKERVFYTMNGEEKLSSFEYLPDTNENAIKYGDAGAQYHATFLLRELERDNFIISKGDVFVDLGGNIGMSSYFANERGVGEIHSFEPDPEMRKLLSKNVPTANIYPYAISDKESELTLYHWPHNPVNLGPTYSVSCITLKDVLRIVGKKINYLKIDIEGFEENLFDELTPLECSQIEKMMIEYHNVDTLETFCSTLRSKGFDIVHITHGYQAVIYAKYKGKPNMFTCHFEIEEQKIHYSALSNIKDEICVSIRDIDSTAVIWAANHPELVQHSSFWIMPIPKHILDFTTNTTFGGVLVEFYVKGELVQSNYFRIRQPSIKKPKINLPNIKHPIYFNYKEFFIEKIYDKYLANKKYDTVIDIGANIGVWAEYIQHISTVNKLYLVEPNHEALKVLNSHFTKENITVINKAVSDTNGRMNFFTDENNSLISSLTKYNTLDKFYEVETITFSKLVSDYNIDKVNLLKVDIETGEYALFNSLTSDDFNKIDNILLEFHLLAGRTLENDVNPLIEKLKNNGYNVQFHQEHEHGGYIFANR